VISQLRQENSELKDELEQLKGEEMAKDQIKEGT